jgi:hypothetical protein
VRLSHETLQDLKRLPGFAATAVIVRERLIDGPGFVVIRGLPLENLDPEDIRILYTELGSHIGTILSQTMRGDMLYSVRDEGYKIQTDYGPGVRTSKTNAAFDFHTDSPSRVAGCTPDFIGLLVLRTAKTGGESALVSGYTVHNILLRERPDLLSRLYQPFWTDRRAELPPGEEPVLPVPVFTYEEQLTVRYLRFYITKAHEWRNEPQPPEDIEALDFLDEVMRRPSIAAMIAPEPGDLQLVNNRFLLHSRTAYEDHPEPERKRHYLRMWLRQ